MKRKILALSLVLALVSVLVTPMAVLASNQGQQEASTTFATTIDIVDKVADNAITTITFPEGAPSATVSAPYNDVNGSGSPQVLHATTSEPVVRLKNTSGGTLTVTLDITAWSNSVVTGENYELVTTTDVLTVTTVLSADGGAATVDTTISINGGAYASLYLAVDLAATAGTSGTSTLTILGES